VIPFGDGHLRRTIAKFVTHYHGERNRNNPVALWQHPPYFHDGSAATLADMVARYSRVRTLSLTAGQQRDVVEYL